MSHLLVASLEKWTWGQGTPTVSTHHYSFALQQFFWFFFFTKHICELCVFRLLQLWPMHGKSLGLCPHFKVQETGFWNGWIVFLRHTAKMQTQRFGAEVLTLFNMPKVPIHFFFNSNVTIQFRQPSWEQINLANSFLSLSSIWLFIITEGLIHSPESREYLHGVQKIG